MAERPLSANYRHSQPRKNADNLSAELHGSRNGRRCEKFSNGRGALGRPL